MIKTKIKQKFLFWTAPVLFFGLLLAQRSFAHEAYVLTAEQLTFGKNHGLTGLFKVLIFPENLTFVSLVTLGILALFVLNLIVMRSDAYRKLDQWLGGFAWVSPVIVRLAIATAFIYAAFENSFLGPEIQLASIGEAGVLSALLVIAGAMFLFGVFTETAAFFGLALYFIAAKIYGFYMLTYLNYFGEMLILVFVGSRAFALDRKIFGEKRIFSRLAAYETFLVRIFYGAALLYTAISVKILHPLLTLTVVNEYQLTRFHLLFPHDPVLVVAGAAVVECVIGLFIILGFQLRLTVLISLFYLTMSLLFFKEAVWPHIILYGISINLLLNGGGKFTIDRWFANKFGSKFSTTGDESF